MERPSNEAQTRRDLIDRQLAAAGWSVGAKNLFEEFILKRQEPLDQAYRGKENEYADYVLTDHDQIPIAIVEAKRLERDALAGKRQASDYADRIKEEYGVEPFIFLTNGETIYFWDRETSAPFRVSGFFSPSDLERLAFLRKYRSKLNNVSPDFNITDRAYQQEAIKHILEDITQGQRHFLLVMATGTGKTRTVVSLVDLLMRANWIQRVLFLVDRRELVRQALADFKDYMPHASRTRIEGRAIDTKARIHVATYPSMMHVYKQLSPGYYDLIIADESHRSIYNHYKALLDYFAAMQLGLTATPTDYIDHNTFELFKCPDGLPTFYYPYEKAVEENYLAQYRVLDAKTAFQLEGIKAGQLPPEIQKQLAESGIDLSEINFEGSDLERRVTNTGTNDAIVHEFFANCRKDATGTLPAKSIIFAMSHRHAVELLESFRRARPDLQRRGLAEVIDSHMERAEEMLDDFKHKDMPRVAISVDMLDTGVDVPSVENLVFAKPVFSYVKFWQMIGRGTRLWQDRANSKIKNDFLVLDHWNNFSYFNLKPEGEIASTTEPLPVRLFRARLRKLEIFRARDMTNEADGTIEQLQMMLAHVPTDNINVRPHMREINGLQAREAWQAGAELTEHIQQTIAPLLRFASGVNLQVMTFELRTEQLALAQLESRGDEINRRREQIKSDLKLLPEDLPQVAAVSPQLAWALSGGFWEHLEYQRIMEMQKTFAPLMRYRQRQKRDIIRLNLPDKIVTRRWIIYGPTGEGAFAESYREQIEAQVRRLASEVPALHKLKSGEELNEEDLRTLEEALNSPDLFITEERLREVYERPDADLQTFMRHILGVAALQNREEQIAQLFDEFIHEHAHFSAMQINFLRTVKVAVQQGARLQRKDLQQPPFNRIGDVQRLFTEEEQAELLTLTQKFVA